MPLALVILKDKRPNRSVPIGSGQLVLGRHRNCDLRFKFDLVSRQHCKLLIDGVKVFIEDLGSSNGTFVNRRRIQQRTSLTPGDVVRLGTVRFMLQANGHPVDPPIYQDEVEASEGSTGSDSDDLTPDDFE